MLNCFKIKTNKKNNKKVSPMDVRIQTYSLKKQPSEKRLSLKEILVETITPKKKADRI
jgi:hypothetical protein